MARFTIVLVDDHELLRHGLRNLLEREPGNIVVAEAADGLSALDRVAELKPDVVVVDLVLPGMSGLELLRQLQRRAPRSRLVVLSMHTDTLHISEALRAGALCYVLKDAPPSEIARAVQEAAAGRRYLCQNLNQELLASSLAQVGTSVDEPYDLLTESERAVLVLAAQGQTSAAIARMLSLSTRTVETYRANLLQPRSGVIGQPAQILVVDDEAMVRETLAALLRRRGYTVAMAGDGPAALQQLYTQAFDLVVLDLFLPNMHGQELAYHIRSRQPAAEILVLTGNTVAERIPVDAEAYVYKTAAPHEVLAGIANLLEHGVKLVPA